MAKKPYNWAYGATLEEHSKRKLKILREYFFQYLDVRCKLPQQEKFRLAIVDGFAGGGQYKCGTSGSPLIFLEELSRAVEIINLNRAIQSLGQIEIECLLILNDANRDAFEVLKNNIAPRQAEIIESQSKLHLRIEWFNENFEDAYPKMKALLESGRFRNVLFNLDQCGHSHVDENTLHDIMASFKSAEIFYTFVINSLIAFLHKKNPEKLKSQLKYLNLGSEYFKQLEGVYTQKLWLGTAERIVFDTLSKCAPFVSPFSINKPNGWDYWLIHFANNYRARQVYNNVLHENSTFQAHFGRSGLNMLSFAPSDEQGTLHLFDQNGRIHSKNQLMDDIPKLVNEFGDVLNVGTFYENVYNITPAHSDDINSTLIENPDLEIITPVGGERRKANTISVEDVIRLKRQRSFFPMFSRLKSK